MKPDSSPWIQIDTGILSDPRIIRLAELMHTTPVHGVGLVVSFWADVFNTFKSQIIPTSRIKEIWGLPVEYLIQSRFIHPSQSMDCPRCAEISLLPGYYIVHDWSEIAFAWLLSEERTRIRREQDIARQRKRRGIVADQTIHPYKVKRVRPHQGLRKAPVKVREHLLEEIKKIEKI